MKNYDCIVVGFGTAGAIAAIKVARMGLKVLVIEKNSYAGGTQTGGFIRDYYIQSPSSIMEEVDNIQLDNVDFLESKKQNLESIALQLGVDISYSSMVLELEIVDQKVKKILWIDGEDNKIYTPTEYIVDATAEGFICQLAGCESYGGRASDGLYQPFTNTMARIIRQGQARCANFDAGRIDQNSLENLSETMLTSANVHLYDSYEEHRDLLVPSDMVGVREGLHVKTEQIYTFKNLIEDNLVVDDPIFYAYTNIDTHANDMPLESELFQKWMIGSSMWGIELSIPVPLGTIIPQGIKNIIIAGRHLGVDHDLGHAVRMNSCMGAIGEAAGIVVAIAHRTKVSLKEVKYEQIRPYLVLDDSKLSGNERIWSLSEDEVFENLSSSNNGPALWSAKQRIPIETLQKWYDNAVDGSDFKRHVAFALALKNSDYGLCELRKMVEIKDQYMPTHSRRYNHKRGYSALFFLGILQDKESIDLIKEIFNYSGENIYEYHTHALLALMRIASKHSDVRPQIEEFLQNLAISKEWYLEAKLLGTKDSYQRMDTLFRAHIISFFKK